MLHRSEALDWVAKAAEDEVVVDLIWQNGGPWSLAAYHVQQAAEKLLKAVLAESGTPIPKTHDLVHLVSLMPPQFVPVEVDQAVAQLTAYAWITRYPGGPAIDRAHVEQCLLDFKTIQTWALT